MRFTLTLVRHGESEANVRHMLSGWMDVDLTENGKKELRELRRSVEYPESEAYFCSPLKRCKDTFRILFPDKCPTISDEYKEINFRTLEGLILPTKEEIYTYFSSWVEDKPVKDEETISDVMKRGSKALLDTVGKCEKEGKHSATIVTHSGIMRSSVIALFNLDKKEFLDMFVPNGLGYVLTFEDLHPLSYEVLDKNYNRSHDLSWLLGR